MSNIPPNEIRPDLLSVCSINPFHQHVSSQRAYMFANNLGQMLVVDGSDEKTIQSGMEREYGKYTFSVEMPDDGIILEIIDRYGDNQTINGPSMESPEKILIYENIHNKEIGMIRLPNFCSNHQYFGFRYVAQPAYNRIRVGQAFSKGTVFLDSPSKTEDGGYKFGVNANIAYMTHPATAEDGILIRKGFLDKLKFRTYETRVVEWGYDQFALNLYGDLNTYKTFPDIGDFIRDDGVLMALRTNDPAELAVVEKGVDDTMNIDYTFDTTIYAAGAGGKVVDIKIDNDFNKHNYSLRHKDMQPQEYVKFKKQFCERVVSIYNKLKRSRGNALQLTPEFHRFIVECLSAISENGKHVKRLYRQVPLDTFRIEFKIEYVNEVNVGNKLTDLCGGKGVICRILEDQYFPVDLEGNRADVIMDPNSTFSRMNISRFYEQYFNGASRHVHNVVCRELGVKPYLDKDMALSTIQSIPVSTVDRLYDYILNYYKIVSPKMYDWLIEGKISYDKVEYLSEIVSSGVYLYIPTNNSPDTTDIVSTLESMPEYRQVYGPVTYLGDSGKVVTTLENIRIAPVYMILLEKIGDTWSAVSSGKIQHFGVLSQLTKNDKFNKPARNQAVRGAGEAEVRVFISYIGTKFVVEMMDRNNNPTTHKLIVNKILSADKPTNIDNLVDRKIHPFGGNKPVQLVNHILQVSGIKFKYSPHQPYIQNIQNGVSK